MLVVLAQPKWPIADVLACPESDGYNDRISGKEKTPPFGEFHRFTGDASQKNSMLIVSNYTLVEKSPGVFC